MKDKHFNLFLALTGATVLSPFPEMGQITVANSATNYAGSFAQDVTGYLAGMPSDDETQSLELICPSIQTNDFFRFAKADDQDFLTEADDSDIRARGAAFKRIAFSGTQVTDQTLQKGLTIRVEHKDLPKINGTVIPGWENRYALALRKRLVRADKVRAYAVIDAASTDLAVTFSASTNPDGLLRAMCQTTRTATGRFPTHCIIGNASWEGRIDAYEAAARTNPGSANHADYDVVRLANYLRVGKVIVETGIKQLSAGAAKANQLGLVNYSYSASDSPILDDPSNIRRAWTPVKGGGEWAVSVQEHDVYTDITVWHESKIFCPQSTGVRKTTVTLG